MSKSVRSFRNSLMLCAASALVCSTLPALADQASTTPQVNLGGVQFAQAGAPASAPVSSESITVKARRLLVKEKNSPSAVTELGQKQIDAVGVAGSVATLLRQAPSIYVYQQGIGSNEPVLSIRGVRGLEVAQTLDGVPMQDLLQGGTGGYLANNLGGHFNLDQIDGVSIYPGVAYPDKNTFGTIGGTVAYTSKRPTNDYYLDLFGSVGSFQTFNEGFTLNSGAVDSPLGTGDNAAKVLLQYSNLQTQGFIDYTPARYNNMEFAFDKPYDDGLSKFQATVLYNTGSGLIQSEPTPVPYLNQNGLFSNYAPNLLFQNQVNDYLSLILKDDTYINDNLNVGLTLFYLNSDTSLESYGNPLLFTPPGSPNPYIVGGAAPFVQTPAGFGAYASLYGPNGPFWGANYGAPGNLPIYNPSVTFANNTAACPPSIVAAWGGIGNSPCGIVASLGTSHNDTYGIQPRLTYIAPDIFGISNTIKLGGLLAKETSPTGNTWLWGTPNIPQTRYNQTNGFFGSAYDGGQQRTIYQGYIQDKIDFLDNTLHITPGVTLEGTLSSNLLHNDSNQCDANGVCGQTFKGDKWDREWLPFFNLSYDFDKVVPALAGTSIYGSLGESALFAPASDISPNLAQGVPYASIVHMYEAGIQYDTSKLALKADYFYQKIDRDFGFSEGQVGPLAGDSIYTNDGQRELKGVEASAQWQVTPSIQLFANGSHTLAKYLDSYLASVTVFEDQFGLAQKGTNNTGIPDWLSSFGVDYEAHDLMRDGDSFTARFEGEYTGQQYTTYDLTGYENIPIPGGKSLFTNILNPYSCTYGGSQCDPTNTTAYQGKYLPESYVEYLYRAGATTTNPNNRLAAFAVFNLLLSYTMPTPTLPVVKRVKFDLNVQNLFNQHYYQYYYNQVTPANCPDKAFAGTGGATLPQSSYSCVPAFDDGLPGEPFAVTFTVTARF